MSQYPSWPGLTWLDPAIHVLLEMRRRKTWMPGTRPGMTDERVRSGGNSILYLRKIRHGELMSQYPSWPGLTRPSTSYLNEKEGVDARHKAGHDG
jgi:hypothetical protein